MKQDIHPQYQENTVHCACGSTFVTRSTSEKPIHVDVCSSCHPFFTGQQKIMDTAGRIDRLKKKFGDKVNLGGQKKSKSAPLSIRDKLRAGLPKKEEGAGPQE